MNIEIANRLVTLRKENNLSQEALAEKLGISRQAVSKWERAEASPDTDNLILLARLYQVSLDDLLKTDEDILPERIEETKAGEQRESKAGDDSSDGRAGDEKTDCRAEEETASTEDGESRTEDADPEEYVHVGFGGVHVKDKDGEVHVGWDGIHVTDATDEVHIDKKGAYVNGEAVKGHLFMRGHQAEFPLGLIITVVYIALGCICGLWHPGWLIFLLIPVIGSAIHAIQKRNPAVFAYPVLTAFLFLFAGFVYGVWHPAWVIFLTVPIYYELIKYFSDRKKKRGE